jgi:hypothetical protein
MCVFTHASRASLYAFLGGIRFTSGLLKINLPIISSIALEVSFMLKTRVHFLENDMFLYRFLRSVIGFLPNLWTFKRDARLYASLALAIKEQTNPVAGALARAEQATARAASLEKESIILVDLIAKHEVVVSLFIQVLDASGHNISDQTMTRLGIKWNESVQIRRMLESLTSLQRELLWLLIQSAHKSGWKTDFLSWQPDLIILDQDEADD